MTMDEVESAARAVLKDAGYARLTGRQMEGGCDSMVTGILPWLRSAGFDAERLYAEVRLVPTAKSNPWAGHEAESSHHAVLLNGQYVLDVAGRQFRRNEPLFSTLSDFKRRWRRVVVEPT